MTAQTRIPPFKSIEAFVAAARSLSFSEAASLLHITVPAVSRRIQALERELGVALFQRNHRTLALTQAGESFFGDLEPALEVIRRASNQVRTRVSARLVKVSMPASLAANWLLPRLSDFHATHCDIRVEIASMVEQDESVSDHSELDKGEADIAIRLGDGHWPGMQAARLFDLAGFPVCSPTLATQRGGLHSPCELAALPLLGVKGQPDLWPEWCRNAGLDDAVRMHQEFDSLHLLYRAAVCGLGIALGLDVLVQPYLDNGQLVRPFNSEVRLSKSYYIVCQAADLSRRPVLRFRDWLRAQAARDHNSCEAR